MPLDILDDHDGVVDDDAGGENDGEQGQGVDGEVHHLDERERADERHRDRDRRDDGAAPGLQEHEDDQHDERDRLEQVFTTSAIDSSTTSVVLKVRGTHPWGNCAASRSISADNFLLDVEGAGRWSWITPKPPRRRPGTATATRRFPRELGAADVLSPTSAAGPLFTMMLVELGGLAKTSDGAHAHLGTSGPRGRRLADAPGRDLHVLLAQRADDVPGGDPAGGQAVGVGQSRIEHLRSPKMMTSLDPGNALQRIAHVDVEVVAEEERVAFRPSRRRPRPP